MSDVASTEPVAEAGRRSGDGPETLVKGLNFPGVLMQSVGLMAPTATLILSVQFIAGFAGIATPFAFVVAAVIMFLLAITLSDIAKRLPSAGGYYTFVRAGIGSRAGLFIAILSLFYILSPSMNSAYLAEVVSDELKSTYSISIAWPIFFVAMILFCGYFAYRGAKFSGRALVVLGGLECLILVALGAWGLADPGPGGVSLQVFNPSNVGSQGLIFGVTFSLFLFAGWEGAAPVAEETDNPRRNIPRALMLSVALAGAVIVFATWGMLSGYGVDHVSAFAESEELPAFALAHQYWHGAGIILLLAVLNSVLVISLAATMVCTRVLYAFSRAGVAPAWLGKIETRHHSPINAILAVTIFSLVVGLVAGATVGPANSYFIFGLAFTLALVIVYISGNVAVAGYFRKAGLPLHGVRQILLPIVTSAALVYVFYKTIHPMPEYPVAAGIWLAVGWGLAAAVYAYFVGHRAGDADIATLTEEI